MKELKEVDSQLSIDLQEIANSNKALLLSFIAPDKIVRKNPNSYDYATITVQDFYNIEKVVERLKDSNSLPDRLHLIIQTPGGELYASTKIIRYLQTNFKNIEAYVPYEAASGGTMMCLAANFIVMHATSSLTPIDPQIVYKGQRISALTYEQAIQDFQEKFGTFRPDEIPSPHQQLASQFDPVIAKEMRKTVYDSLSVAYDILLKSQKPKNEAEKNKLFNLVFALGKTEYPHSHVITIDEAKKIGLNINLGVDKLNLLKTYKKWVSKRLNEEETSHIIESFCPELEVVPNQTNEKDTQNSGKK